MPRSRTRQPLASSGHDPKKGRTSREKDVDKAVEMTFPASDATTPGHATSTEPAMRPTDRRAPVISKDDIEAAAKGAERKSACPSCGGSGKVGDARCPKCAGIGAVPDTDST